MALHVTIRVKNHRDDHWLAWFEGLTISNEPGGETVVSGTVADQAALHGVLMRIRDLGLTLLSVSTEPPETA